MRISNSHVMSLDPEATKCAAFQALRCFVQATCPTQIKTTFCVRCTIVDATLQDFKCQCGILGESWQAEQKITPQDFAISPQY